MALRVFLVPGFFGFTNLGDFAYFSHFREVLAERLADAGVDAVIHPLDTLPTSSMLLRARRLLDHVKAHYQPGDEIHLVGHSTGGLDARLLASEGLSIQGRDEILAAIRSVTTVASPHRGTPTAAFFSSLLGQRILRLLSLVTVATIRFGSVPLPVLMWLGGAFASTGALSWASGGVFDQVYNQVLKDFDDDRRKSLEEFFDKAYEDQTLLPQLSPEAMDVVHAVTRAAPHVRCASVVAMAPAPSLERQRAFGLKPFWHAQYAIYRALHLIASTTPETLHNFPDATQRRVLVKAFGDVPAQTDNDGMVPALSQVWEKVIHATYADHMDVMGHFHGPGLHPRHVDWLRTGSNFGPREFDELLAAVAKHIVGP